MMGSMAMTVQGIDEKRGERDDIAEVNRVFALQKAHRWTMAMTTASERLARLAKFGKVLESHREDLYRAMLADFRKHPTEVEITELYVTLSELAHTRAHLKKWLKPR